MFVENSNDGFLKEVTEMLDTSTDKEFIELLKTLKAIHHY